MRYPHIRIHYIEVLCATGACGGGGRGLREILWLRVPEIERRYCAGKAAGRFITPSRAKPARVGDPGCGPRDDNGGEPTLKNEGWGTRKGPKVPRAAHKGRERTLGYKGTKSEKQIPRPAHPITRKTSARWGPWLRASG